MCYPKPGPRCSSHAAKKLARAWIACLTTEIPEDMTHKQKMATMYKVIERREKAQEEFYATPAGIAQLEQKVREKGYGWETAKDKLQKAKAQRAHQLSLIKAKDQGDIGKHSPVYIGSSYEKMGLRTEFPAADEPRLGWQVRMGDKASQDQKNEVINKSKLMNRASEVWMNRLNPEQVAMMHWLTEEGTRILTAHTAPPGKGEELSKLTTCSPAELDRRMKVLKEAFAKAPKLREPVILHRGISSQNPFDADKVIADGEYTAPSVLSATTNPGVANSFAWGNVMLEMRTRKFACASLFSSHGDKESEVMLAPGSKWKVVGVQRDATYGWSKEYPVNGYTVIQLEEVD